MFMGGDRQRELIDMGEERQQLEKRMKSSMNSGVGRKKNMRGFFRIFFKTESKDPVTNTQLLA